MSDLLEKAPSIRHYFVDEAGDPTLFNSKGKVIIQSEGCSRFFMLGVLDVVDPEFLIRSLEELRSDLLADPYFKKVPSMQAEYQKTAIAFHAKDDIPEVRREVFNLLKKLELKFFAVIRDKQKLLEYVRGRNQSDLSYCYHPNELYDYLTRRLFKHRLHKDDGYNICFAKRGNSDRTAALKGALELTRNRFNEERGVFNSPPINITATTPPQSPCLQATDYFLWALQRLYERREERYVEFILSSYKLVHDIDDTREHVYGAFYNKKNPLTLLKMPEI